MITSNEFSKSLKKSLIKIGLNKPLQPHYTPHSLRHGEITDMYAAHIPHHIIQKHARNVKGSKSTFQYCHLQGIKEANLISFRFVFIDISLQLCLKGI